MWGVDLSQVGSIALMLIMVTMGFTLTLADFKRLLLAPKPVIIGLIAQLVLLPAMAFALVTIFQPPLPIAIGVIILACCPSGATSNFFTHLAGGNVAISVSLTSISGIIVIFTIPLLVNLAIALLGEPGPKVFLPVVTSMMRIFMLILAPVIVGMAFRHWKPILAESIEPYATKVSFSVIILLMLAVLWHLKPILGDIIASAGLITLALNISMMALGFALALIFKLEERDARSICVEVGVQNYLLSVIIAIGLLQNPSFAVVPIVYLFTMYLTVFSFIAYCRYVRDVKMSHKHTF